jgi:hypothetical protein
LIDIYNSKFAYYKNKNNGSLLYFEEMQVKISQFSRSLRNSIMSKKSIMWPFHYFDCIVYNKRKNQRTNRFDSSLRTVTFGAANFHPVKIDPLRQCTGPEKYREHGNAVPRKADTWQEERNLYNEEPGNEMESLASEVRK